MIQVMMNIFKDLVNTIIKDNHQRYVVFSSSRKESVTRKHPDLKTEFSVPTLLNHYHPKVYVYGFAYPKDNSVPYLEVYVGLNFLGYLNLLDPRNHELEGSEKIVEELSQWVEQNQLNLINFEIHKDLSKIRSLVKT